MSTEQRAAREALNGRELRPGMMVNGEQVRRVEEVAYWAVYIEGDIYPRIYDLDHQFHVDAQGEQ